MNLGKAHSHIPDALASRRRRRSRSHCGFIAPPGAALPERPAPSCWDWSAAGGSEAFLRTSRPSAADRLLVSADIRRGGGAVPPTSPARHRRTRWSDLAPSRWLLRNEVQEPSRLRRIYSTSPATQPLRDVVHRPRNQFRSRGKGHHLV